jgi:hypothetical protein
MRSKSDRNTLFVLMTLLCGILITFGVNTLTNGIHLSKWGYVAVGISLIVLIGANIWILDRQYSRPWKLSSQSGARDRRARMLTRIRHDWIDGYLNTRSNELAQLDLQLADKSSAVERPIDRLVQRSRSQEPHLLPIGTRVISIFDENIGQLLILGAPGYGKTTLLLELTQALLNRAGRDKTLPIPVVFSLSSWAAKRHPLADWLSTELNNLYDEPRASARALIDEDRILLLLDGLDEVAAEYREACVHAINAFHKERGFVPIVVCCRSDEYASLSQKSVKLQLQGAVEVQLLSPDRLERYIRGSGEAFRGLQEALDGDPSLLRFIASPLMVQFAAAAYRTPPSPKEPSSLTVSPTLDLLFERYVAEMLSRRTPVTSYDRNQVDGWLAWLGYSLAHLNQRVFHLENLEQGWLRNEAQQRILNAGLLVFIALIVFVTASSLTIYGFRGDRTAIGVSVASGVMVALFSTPFGRLKDLRPVDRIRLNLREVPRSLWIVLKSFSPLFGLYGGIAAIVLLWRADYHGALEIFLGFVLVWILVGMGLGLPIGLWRALVPGELALRPAPNDGTRRSALSALYTVLFLAVSGATACALIGLALTAIRIRNGVHERLLDGMTDGLRVGVVIGLMVGTVAALYKGGIFCLRHFAVRAQLSAQGAMPWNYARFLDFAADRLLLRKIGGGYIFAHDLLRDHFAKQYDRAAQCSPAPAGDQPPGI